MSIAIPGLRLEGFPLTPEQQLEDIQADLSLARDELKVLKNAFDAEKDHVTTLQKAVVLLLKSADKQEEINKCLLGSLEILLGKKPKT